MSVFTHALQLFAWPCLVLSTLCCSSSDHSNGNPATGGQSGLDASSLSSNSISIENFSFVPANIVVLAGTIVTVDNHDAEPHSVTSEANMNDFTNNAVQGVRFDTGSIGPGASGEFTVLSSAASGTIVPYYCSVHKSTMMQGTVTIK